MNSLKAVGAPDVDLLAHKYRPDCADDFGHPEQASRLKQWILDYITPSTNTDSNSEFTDVGPLPRCVLLTGPPGVGKTSLVYTVASELKLHVVEAHSSERRDSKLFGMLKLTNQKGKINAFDKMFQAAQKQQMETRRKRRKLAPQPINANQQIVKPLTLSGDTSLVLFDDIDVVFEEDGPFLKSLAEFISESKRPIVLTATKSIEFIKETLRTNLEQIHLDKPVVEDCAKLLSSICKKEKLLKLSNKARCQKVASLLDCDIRQCLNRIQFYGDSADQTANGDLTCDYIHPSLERLNLIEPDREQSVLKCYTNRSIVDLMDSRLNLVSRSDLLERWLDGIPSHRNENTTFNHRLGEQIKESIVELTAKLYPDDLRTDTEIAIGRSNQGKTNNEFQLCCKKMNDKIKSRIEPPECDFYVDVVPYLGELVRQEAKNRGSSGGFARRSRRVKSYLETIGVFFEPDDVLNIAVTSLNSTDSDDIN